MKLRIEHQLEEHQAGELDALAGRLEGRLEDLAMVGRMLILVVAVFALVTLARGMRE